MKAVKALLEGIKENNSQKKTLGLGDKMLDYLIEEASFDSSKHWVKAIPAIPVKEALKGLGTTVSGHREALIARPSCLRKVGNEIWIGSSGRSIARFDENFSFLGYWIGTWDNPNNDPDSYKNTRSFTVDQENNRIYVVMENRHLLRAFNLSEGTQLWEYGNGKSGDLINGQLDNPTDVELLPNGNILVCSSDGRGYDPETGEEGEHHGHISEFDSNTGQLVKSRVMYKTDGQGWQKEVSRPVRARILTDGKLYISLYNKHHIAVWNPETWEYLSTYSKPAGFDIDGIFPRGITLSLDGKELVTACNGPKMLIALGIEDRDYKWHSGFSDWDDRKQARNKIGGFGDIWDVLPMGNNSYLVADYGNNRVQIVPNTNNLVIQHNVTIPQGYKVVWAPEGYNTETHTLTIPYSSVNDYGEIHLLLERCI